MSKAPKVRSMSACGRRGYLADGWRTVSLGEVVQVNPREPALAADAPFVPMEAIEPGKRWVVGTQVRGSRSGARFRGGDVLFARITPCLENGKVAQYPSDMPPAGGSTELLVLRASDEIDAGFLYFWATSEATREAATKLMVGSTGRQRVSATDLASMQISLPPLAEQRRIADLLAHIDDSVVASREAIDALSEAMAVALERDVQAAMASEQRRLGELASVQSGISWAKTDEVTEDSPDSIAVMGVANVQRDFIHADGCTRIPRTPQAEDRAIKPHTLLTIRTNGNADRIGNVHKAPSEAVGHTISSFLTSITTEQPGDSDYVLRVLQSPPYQRAITQATSGSTGLKNIAVTWIRNLEIPWPSEAERTRTCNLADGFEAAITAHRDLTSRAERLRAAVLTGLLSGLHAIPADYDRLLNGEVEPSTREPAEV